MSDNYGIKGEQQIYSEIGGLVSAFFTNNGYENWANGIMQWGQPTMQELPSPAILMNFENARKYGWTTTSYQWNKTTQAGSAIISWIRVIRFTFTFFLDGKNLIGADPMTYVSALDMAEKLRAYFLSDFGIQDLQQYGYGSFDIGDILNPDFSTDENIYARQPSFTVPFVFKENIVQNYPDYKTYIEQQEDFKSNKSLTGIYGV